MSPHQLMYSTVHKQGVCSHGHAIDWPLHRAVLHGPLCPLRYSVATCTTVGRLPPCSSCAPRMPRQRQSLTSPWRVFGDAISWWLLGNDIPALTMLLFRCYCPRCQTGAHSTIAYTGSNNATPAATHRHSRHSGPLSASDMGTASAALRSCKLRANSPLKPPRPPLHLCNWRHRCSSAIKPRPGACQFATQGTHTFYDPRAAAAPAMHLWQTSAAATMGLNRHDLLQQRCTSASAATVHLCRALQLPRAAFTTSSLCRCHEGPLAELCSYHEQPPLKFPRIASAAATSA